MIMIMVYGRKFNKLYTSRLPNSLWLAYRLKGRVVEIILRSYGSIKITFHASRPFKTTFFFQKATSQNSLLISSSVCSPGNKTNPNTYVMVPMKLSFRTYFCSTWYFVAWREVFVLKNGSGILLMLNCRPSTCKLTTV